MQGVTNGEDYRMRRRRKEISEQALGDVFVSAGPGGTPSIAGPGLVLGVTSSFLGARFRFLFLPTFLCGITRQGQLTNEVGILRNIYMGPTPSVSGDTP